MWAAQLYAHGDNRGFQSREARVSSEIVLAQRGHSWLRSQTIPGGGARHRNTGTTGPWVPGPVLPLQALSQLLPHSGPQFPTCELALKAYLEDTFQLQGSKTRLSGAVKPHGQEAPTQPTRPQALHLRLKPPFPYLQNGEGSFLPHRALRFK